MPAWMAAIEDFFSRGGGYTSGALLLATLSMALRYADKLDNSTLGLIVIGVFGANSIGGAISAFRK